MEDIIKWNASFVKYENVAGNISYPFIQYFIL